MNRLPRSRFGIQRIPLASALRAGCTLFPQAAMQSAVAGAGPLLRSSAFRIWHEPCASRTELAGIRIRTLRSFPGRDVGGCHL